MDKNRYDDYSTESFNVSDKTPMLGKTKQDSSFITKRCIVIVGVVVLISIVASLIIFSNYVFNMEIPDPDNPPPPSSLPMGVYRSVGVVSNGGPCAQVGVDVMSRGGNAVDAAIATMLCDGVVCPQYMGVGGGFIMSLYNATTKKVTSIKSRESAPAAANTTMYVKDPKSSEKGGLAIAVPGALRGYATIYRLYGGKVSWESLFKPTIELCENGITISIPLAMALKSSEKFLKKDPMLKKIFFDEHTGHVKKVGETYKLTKLGETMRVLSKEGSEALYNGSLTSQFVEDLRKVNSIITKEDLINYVVEIEKTFQVNLKSGHTVHAGRPPTSGIVLAYILRILDGMLPAPNAALDVHRIVEAFKFAYGERSHLGDHKFVNVSSIYEKISSDSYMESVRRKITDNSTSLDPKFYGADYQMSDNHGTANIVVTDSSGNAVVVTSTINTSFGSGFMSPSTGIIMNNEMNDFSTPGATNSYGFPPSPSNFIKPGKRPMSSNCPTVITDKDGNFVLGAGAAGGSKITLTTAYICALKLWFNRTLKEALDAPRFYHQLMPMEIQYEYGMTRDVVQKLKEIGHPMLRLSHNRGSGATAIYKSPDGLIDAMPDFRRLGNCSGY